MIVHIIKSGTCSYCGLETIRPGTKHGGIIFGVGKWTYLLTRAQARAGRWVHLCLKCRGGRRREATQRKVTP